MHIHLPNHWRGVLKSHNWLQTSLGLALLGLVLAGLALAGWLAVGRSQAALPGDSLYGVKRLSEQVTLALTLDPAARAQAHGQLLHTRLYEIVALLVAGRYEDLPAAVDELRAEIDSTAVAARALAEGNQIKGVEFVAQMEQMLTDTSQLLATLAQAGPPDAQPIVGKAVVAAVAGSGVLRAQLPLAANMALNNFAPPATAAPIVATAMAAVPTDAATLTSTVTGTPPVSASGTPAPTASPTATPVVTAAASPTPARQTQTPGPLATPTGFSSATPQATDTSNPGPNPSATATLSPVSTLPQPTLTQLAPPTPTISPAAPTSTASNTPAPSATPLPTSTHTLPTATRTPLPSATPQPTATPAPTNTPGPLATLLTAVASLLAP